MFSEAYRLVFERLLSFLTETDLENPERSEAVTKIANRAAANATAEFFISLEKLEAELAELGIPKPEVMEPELPEPETDYSSPEVLRKRAPFPGSSAILRRLKSKQQK